MKRRKERNIEWRRRLFHLALGITLVILLYYGLLGRIGVYLPLPFLPVSARTLFVILLMGSVLVVLSRKYRIPIIFPLLQFLGRPNEQKIFPGKSSFFYILGAFIVTTLFETGTAIASLAILAIADPISHVIGVKYGTVKTIYSHEKCVDGNFVGIAVGALCASFFVPVPHALAASTVAMFAELIDMGKAGKILDDNLTIPVIAAIVLWFLTSI